MNPGRRRWYDTTQPIRHIPPGTWEVGTLYQGQVSWNQFPREFAEGWAATVVKHLRVQQVPGREPRAASGNCTYCLAPRRHMQMNPSTRFWGTRKVYLDGFPRWHRHVITGYFPPCQRCWRTYISPQSGAYTCAPGRCLPSQPPSPCVH